MTVALRSTLVYRSTEPQDGQGVRDPEGSLTSAAAKSVPHLLQCTVKLALATADDNPEAEVSQ